MPRILSAALLIVIALPLPWAEEPPPAAPATTPAATAARQPLPSAAAMDAAQQALRETLKDAYAGARRPEERVLLARRLLEQAKAMTGADGERLAMLREAAELAARAGDAAVALDALDALDARFDLEPAERLRVLVLAAAKPATAASATLAGEALCGLAEDAIAADRYPFAQKAAKEADTVARRLKDPLLAARAKPLVERAKLLGDEFEKLGEVADLLGGAPPATRQRLGRFLCFSKGDWPRGLPQLAGGDDEVLAAAARAELVAATPEAGLAVADAWYAIAQKERAAAKEELLAHALGWYRRAAATLQGPARIRLDKRLDELERAVSATGRRVRYPPGAVLLLTFERETLTRQGLAITQVLDASGHELRAVASGAPTVELGGHGYALSLDGRSWLTIANAKELQIAGDQTISLWLKPQALSLRSNPFNKSYCDEGSMTLEPGGLLNYFYGTAGNGGADQAVALPAAGVLGRWSHVVLVRDLAAKRLTWYKDGRKDVEVAAKYPTATLSTQDLLIGNGYTAPYVGQLDDVGVWPRALSAG